MSYEQTERCRRTAAELFAQATGCAPADAQECVEAVAQYVVRKMTGTKKAGDVEVAEIRSVLAWLCDREAAYRREAAS